MDILSKIKRLAIARKIIFTRKAEDERLLDGLTIDDIIESITRAAAIKKIIRSKSSGRILKKEKLYIIESPNLSGTWIYTKGTTRKTKDGSDVFYVLVSSKMSD
jgi:hypothetical protein